MATKIDPLSAEHHILQFSVTTSTSSVVSAPKVSMFGAKAKSGFVIPKNKLAGSLVPKFRPQGKTESSNASKEENTRQVHRRTKWGPDLTLDAAVMKGRVLAYQTRLEQITELLKSESLDTTNNQGLRSPEKTMDDGSVGHTVNNEALDLELLELEKREVIGELLCINPSYKPPSDYKPLLKEAKIPIPTKEHAGNKFVTLLLGPASNTQKRLEEETGARVQIHGVKRDTKEKSEVALSNISDVGRAYEELYISVLADTFEKVDAAVQLIELLLTPVTSNNAAVTSTVSTSGSGDNALSIESNQKEITSSYMTTALPIGDVSHGTLQPIVSNAPSDQQQYPSYAVPWYPSAYAQPSTGSVPTSVPHNAVPFAASPVGPFLSPSYSGQPPQFGSTRGSITPAAFRPLISVQSFQQPLPLAAPSQAQTAQQPSGLYPSLVPQTGSTMPPFTASQPTMTGAMPASRPAMPFTPPLVSGPFPNRSLPTASPGGSGWSSILQGMQPSQRPAFLTPPMRPNLVISPHMVGGPPTAVNHFPMQSNIPPNVPNRPTGLAYPSMLPQPRSFSSPAMLPLTSGAPIVTSSPVFTPRPSLGPSPVPRLFPMPAAPAPMSSAQASGSSHPLTPVRGWPLVTAPSFASVQARRPDQAQALFQEKPPNAGSLPGFSPATQATATSNSAPVTLPKPLRPISGDFTFQPLRTQVPAAVAHNQSAKQAPVPLVIPQPPSFRPAGHNLASSFNSQGLPRPLATNPSQAIIPPPPAAAAFSVSPAIKRPSSNFPAFSDTNAARPMDPTCQIGPSSFPSASVRPVNTMQPPMNQGLRENQIYDPLSPTSISSAPPKKGETDAEYEDLMVSFGVK